MDTYRTFVAIELPTALRAKLIEHIAHLRRELPEARASWSREHNLHLTLKFLGNVPVSDITKLSGAVARAVRGIKPFELTVAGCGAFPSKGRPNVLWMGIEDRQEQLTALYLRIEGECANADFAREERSFHPHLTIARLRKAGYDRQLAEAHKHLEFRPQTFRVPEIVVFKSELLRDGSKHTAISRHALQ